MRLRRHAARAPAAPPAHRATVALDGRHRLEQALPQFEQHGWTKLVAAIRRILAGERKADALCADLDSQDSMIIETILQGLADPSSLADLMPREGPPPVS